MCIHHRLWLAVLSVGALAMPATATVWTPIGPDGGIIRRLLVDPVTPTTVYAASGNGFYKSTDGGATWNASGVGLPARELPYRIALDPNAPDTLYAGFFAQGPVFGKLFKSTNGGASWSQLPLTGVSIRSLGVDPTTPGRLYIGSSSPSTSLYRSSDGGMTWASTAVSGGSVESLAIDPTTPGVVYAATYEIGSNTDKLFKSIDGGVTLTPTSLVDKDILTITVDPTNASVVYVDSHKTGMGASAIWKSIDGGATWNPSGSGVSTFTSGEGQIVVDPATPATVYFAHRAGVFRSTNGGANWTLASSGLLGQTAYALAIHPTVPTTLWVGTGGDLSKSTDAGASWAQSDAGIRDDEIAALVVDPSDTAVIYAASDSQGVQKTTDGGAHWSAASTGLPIGAMTRLLMNPGSNTTLHGIAVDEFDDLSWVVRSIDGGATWTFTNTDFPTEALLLALATDPTNPAVLYAGIDADAAGGPSLFKSIDTGATWSPTAADPDIIVESIVVASNGRVYAASDFPANLVYRSDDGGASWSSATLPNGALVVAVDPSDPDVVLAVNTSGKVYGSVDGGTSFTLYGTPATGADVLALAIDPGDSQRVYAATNAGVRASIDGGHAWADLSAGLLTRDVRSLALDPVVAHRIYVGTSGASASVRDVAFCATNADCDDVNLCTTDTCMPSDSASDAFGCVHVQPACGPADECHVGAGTCHPETGACSYTNRPNGFACSSDGTNCTTDTCQVGVCTHSASIILSCRAPSVPKASVLAFKNTSPGHATFKWRWKKGDATLGELADPFTDSDYDLCVFDHGGQDGAARFLFGLGAPAGGTCGTRPCWSSRGNAILYNDRDRTPDGIQKLLLKSGSAGSASFKLSAKGEHLTALPSAALTPGVTVQLRRTAPALVCWQATYDDANTLNQPGKFKGKSH